MLLNKCQKKAAILNILKPNTKGKYCLSCCRFKAFHNFSYLKDSPDGHWHICRLCRARNNPPEATEMGLG
jgi:hypothetical protein